MGRFLLELLRIGKQNTGKRWENVVHVDPMQCLIKEGFGKFLSQKELGEGGRVQTLALIRDHEK